MGIYGLDHLFAPRSVAALGRFSALSPQQRVLLNNLSSSCLESFSIVDLDGGPGPAAAGHAGRWCREPGAVPGGLDQVVATLPVSQLSELIEPCVRLGMRSMIVTQRHVTSEEAARLRDAARDHQVRLLGLSSSGLIATSAGVNSSLFSTQPAAGPLALVSQSGTLISAALQTAQSRGLGFSHVVCLGDLVDVDFGDLVDYLAWESEVRCLLLCVENLASVKKFLSACRSAARIKPIVAIKGGRSELGRALIAKHTGREAGEDRVYDTAFRRGGVIRVASMGELLASGAALARSKQPRGDRLGIVSNSGGVAVLAVDQLQQRGARITPLSPALRSRLEQHVAPYSGNLNPICIASDAEAARFAAVVRLYLESAEVDTVLVLMALGQLENPAEVVESVRGQAASCHVELVFVWLGGDEHSAAARRLGEQGVTLYRSVEEATFSYCDTMKYLDNLTNVVAVPPRFDHGLDYRQDTAQAWIESQLSDSGGVAVDCDAEPLLQAYGIRVRPAQAPEVPSAVVCELRIGVRTDLEFGPYLYLGVGGAMGHVVGDEAVMLPPLNRLLARRFVNKRQLAERLQLAEERVAELEEILVRLSQLVVQFPQISQLSIDRLLLGVGGFRAVAGRVVLQDRGVLAPDHLSTAPYPNQYESTATLRDGTPVQIRPIRPEDAESHYTFLRSLSSQTLYNRFFGYKKEISDEQMVRFTQIDYQREIAIVAQVEVDGSMATIGVNRLVYAPRFDRYEFAVVVADTWQGSGIGRVLMECIVDIARDRNIPTIFGMVLGSNHKMLSLVRKIGFTITEREEDAVIIRLDLQSAERDPQHS